jgi:hypothetical protein
VITNDRQQPDTREGHMTYTYAAPRILSISGTDDAIDSEAAIFAAVAAFLLIALGIVVFICGQVCPRNSFWGCVQAVKDYFGSGC